MSLEPVQAAATDTFHNLVHQFSDPLAFYRELVQNAVDAGTQRVDIEVSYDAARGMGIATVQDDGEGMDLAVINTRLTRLFASDKEGDLTRIGRFGIGFVSVFAVSPQAVVVDTGRTGQAWRLIFHPDGSFDRIRLDNPVAGTRVQIYKPLAESEFEGWSSRSRDTLRYWCRYCDVPIRFNGTPINEPFDVEGPVRYRVQEGTTEVVVSVQEARKTAYGFYNGGITLMEGDLGVGEPPPMLEPYRDVLAGLHIRIRSRHLEHNLTRDTVRPDPSWAHVAALLEQAVQGLVARMYDLLALRRGEAWRTLFTACLPQVRRTLAHEGRDVPFIPALNGPPLAWRDLERAFGATGHFLSQVGLAHGDRVVLYDDRTSPVLDALPDLPVVDGSATPLLLETLQAQAVVLLQVGACLAVPVPWPQAEPLVESTVRVLGAAGVRFKRVGAARLGGSAPFVLHASRSGVVPRLGDRPLRHLQPPAWVPALSLPHGHLLFDMDHPLLASLRTLYAVDAVAATCMLARAVCLADGLHEGMQHRLLRHALALVPHG